MWRKGVKRKGGIKRRIIKNLNCRNAHSLTQTRRVVVALRDELCEENCSCIVSLFPMVSTVLAFMLAQFQLNLTQSNIPSLCSLIITLKLTTTCTSEWSAFMKSTLHLTSTAAVVAVVVDAVEAERNAQQNRSRRSNIFNPPLNWKERFRCATCIFHRKFSKKTTRTPLPMSRPGVGCADFMRFRYIYGTRPRVRGLYGPPPAAHAPIAPVSISGVM